MRPLKLIIRAFGPYAKEQGLDFRELRNNGLFLIHGPTGAGKTSIIDAMCFALYGEASGKERDCRHLRSHHADAHTPSEVVFDFSLGSRSYRVARTLEFERPKKRAGGTTREIAKACLWDRTESCGDAEDGHVLASQPTRVTEKVEELLGFKSDQFRSVVVLPQGQFRRLLLAASKEREQILETLFSTGYYRLIEEELKERSKTIESELKELMKERDYALKHAAVDREEGAEKKLEELALETNRLRAALDILKAAEEASQKRLQEGRENNRKIDELAAAGEAHGKLLAQKVAMAVKSVELDRATRALSLEGLEKNLKDREREHEDSLQQKQRAGQALEAAHRALVAAQEALRKEELTRGRRDALQVAMAELEKKRAQVEEIDEERGRLEGIIKLIGAMESDHRLAALVLQNTRKELDSLHGELLMAQKEATSVPLLKESRDGARKEYALALELKDLLPQIEKAAKDHKALEAGLAGIEQELEASKKERDRLERDWLKGQAAHLAEKLASGEPCPVCGSREHPSPARTAEKIPGEDKLRQARGKVEALESKCRDAVLKLSSSAQRLGIMNAQKEEKEKSLGGSHDGIVRASKEKLDASENNLQRGEKAASLVSALQGRQKSLVDTLRSSEERSAGLSGELQELTRSRGASEGILKGLEKDVPECLRSIEALESALREKNAELLRLEQAFETARKAHEVASADRARREESLRKSAEKAAEAAGILVKAGGEFEGNLKKAGFSDAGEYRQSRKTREAMELLDREIKKYDRELHAAEESHQKAKEAAEGLRKCDLSALGDDLAGTKKELGEANQRWGELGGKKEQLQICLEKLARNKRQREAKEEEYKVAGRLAEVAGGENPKKMTFQRYVLAFLLDDILVAATRRLSLMSLGRYSLRRETEKGDLRRSGGLDLMAYDDYTGTERAVATLSGGESFLASLALALGLADVVQAYSGGIRLDTIMVDEGFGSLDPEALELSFKALEGLQQGGRLVGIISHVPELREWITARLEVTAGKKGSTARFVV
ncbi:MAG: SMC family ATPase [Candidatus Eremiobacteraeota bacterium]|nr:SMC family ATPase [Candidatus Eremiobacteraeota bacterium]